MVTYACESAFGAQRLGDLFLREGKAERLHVGNNLTVQLEIGVDLDQNGLHALIGKHVPATGQYLMFKTVDVDLDVVRDRDGIRCDQVIQSSRETALCKFRSTGLKSKINFFAKSVNRAPGAKFAQI